jgi:acyl carrier protein
VLTGKRKYDRFDLDLKMDKVFVMGLIFELEYQLKKQLSDDKVDEVKAPAQIIEMLMN